MARVGVDMSSQLAEVLQGLLSNKRSEALKAEMSRPIGERRDAAAVVSDVMENWLFTTPKGARLEPSNLRKVFNKLLTAAELRRVRFHDLRHTLRFTPDKPGRKPCVCERPACPSFDSDHG